MSYRWLRFLAVPVLALVTPVLATTSAAGQSPVSNTARRPADVPPTPWGDPDLQGVWDFRTLTPLQRPENREALLTAEEAAEIEAKAVQAAVDADRPSEVRTEPLPVGGNVGGYNNFWFDRGAGVVDDRRTSLIVDPPSGRLPTRTETATARLAERAEARRRHARGPEDRSLGERCISWGAPRLGAGYNSYYQILQSRDPVVILMEMIHDARVVPIGDRPPLDEAIGLWSGSARGYWDGDTLVVETRNFNGLTKSFSAFGTSSDKVLTERFTRIDPITVNYEWTVEDPATFTDKITAIVPMTKVAGELHEYACHEGNYGMENILAGARMEELEGR